MTTRTFATCDAIPADMPGEIEPAPKNDKWSAYEHYDTPSGLFEIRHPRKNRSYCFSVWKWSDEVGMIYISGHFSAWDARESIRWANRV